MALGTVTLTLEKINRGRAMEKPLVMATLLCTAGAAGDANAHLYPSTEINALAKALGHDLRGLKLYSVVASPGATGPTDNSDLTLKDAYGIDILSGAGANIVDNAVANRVILNPDTAAVIITGTLTLDIINNLVDSAVTSIVLELVGI